MVYAGSVFIFSILLAVRCDHEFNRIEMRLSDGIAETSNSYGFLEIEGSRKDSFVRVCSKGWNRLHTKLACSKLGFADGLGYHEKVTIRGDTNSKGIMLQDIKNERFFKKICDRHVLLSCSTKPLQDFSSVVPGSFSAFPTKEDRLVRVCREEDNDDIASLVCRHLGFDGGYDHMFSPKLMPNDTEQLRCQGATKLEDCQSLKAAEPCPVINFVCFTSMTLVFIDMNIRVEVYPYCTGYVFNIVKILDKIETYSVKFTFETNIGQDLHYLRIGAICDQASDFLEGRDIYSYSTHLGNCSSFYVNLTLNKATKDCHSSANGFVKFTISMHHMTIGKVSYEEPLFETNPGIIVITVLVVLILFVLALVFSDWKPALPQLTKDSMPRVPPPSLADVTDKAEIHRDFEASGLHVHIIK